MSERARNLDLERELVDLAARAAGFPADGGLSTYADSRALPGGVRQRSPERWRQEIAEELADARNYLVWEIEVIHGAMMGGDPDACEIYLRNMSTLRAVVAAWWSLVRAGQ